MMQMGYGMKKFVMMVAAAMMVALHIQGQAIQTVDSEGNAIPLVTVLDMDGNMIGTTNINGELADVKGAAKITVTHVAYKPQIVTIASLQNGRVTMEDLDYGLDEVEIKPKTYIYVETFYRVYVYRNDSLCYFLSGIMPNAYDLQKKKLEHGSYNQARCEYSPKISALSSSSEST